MNKIFIINGTGGSGKDSFIDFCQQYNKKDNIYYIYNISTIDPVKYAAKYLGWTGSKEEVDRKFLSDLKDLWINYNDGPFNYIKTYVNRIIEENYDNLIIFIHCRESEEINKIKNEFQDNCSTILINKDGLKINSNKSDANVLDYKYDIIINNNGTTEDLFNSAINFIKNLTGEGTTNEISNNGFKQ